MRDSVEGPRARRRMTNAYKNALLARSRLMNAFLLSGSKTIVGHLKMPGSTHDIRLEKQQGIIGGGNWRSRVTTVGVVIPRAPGVSRSVLQAEISCSNEGPQSGTTGVPELTRMEAVNLGRVLPKVVCRSHWVPRDAQWWETVRTQGH